MSTTNSVKYGVSNLHIAFETEEGYETPISIPGTVNISLDVEGDEIVFYADNTKYFTRNTNNGYKGTIENAMIPDDVQAVALGWYADENGNYIEDSDGKQKHFAMGFQVDGDKYNRGVWFYDCVLARPSVNASTTDNGGEPQTDTLDLTIVPKRFEDLGKKVVKTVCPNLDEDSDFFEEVVEPGDPASDTDTDTDTEAEQG